MSNPAPAARRPAALAARDDGQGGLPNTGLPITNAYSHARTPSANSGVVRFARLRAEHPRLISGPVARVRCNLRVTPYDPASIDSLTRLVRQLRGTARTSSCSGHPGPQSVVPFCLSRRLDDARACAWHDRPRSTKAGIAAGPPPPAVGGRYADLTDLFSATNSCPVIVGDTSVYWDSGHVTVEYPRRLGRVIGR